MRTIAILLIFVMGSQSSTSISYGADAKACRQSMVLNRSLRNPQVKALIEKIHNWLLSENESPLILDADEAFLPLFLKSPQFKARWSKLDEENKTLCESNANCRALKFRRRKSGDFLSKREYRESIFFIKWFTRIMNEAMPGDEENVFPSRSPFRLNGPIRHNGGYDNRFHTDGFYVTALYVDGPPTIYIDPITGKKRRVSRGKYILFSGRQREAVTGVTALVHMANTNQTNRISWPIFFLNEDFVLPR